MFLARGAPRVDPFRAVWSSWPQYSYRHDCQGPATLCGYRDVAVRLAQDSSRAVNSIEPYANIACPPHIRNAVTVRAHVMWRADDRRLPALLQSHVAIPAAKEHSR